MRRVVVAFATAGFCALVAFLMLGLSSSAIAEGAITLEPPDLLTNLFQLRQCAGQNPLLLPHFRIVADVLDADSASGVLVLRDTTGVEFIRLELRGRKIEPGATVCLEGNGCGVRKKGFGLAIIPGMVVDNDGLHGTTEKSGKVFVHAGINPITVQWFNRLADFALNVEYEGPGLPRQRIPGSVLSRANVNPTTGSTNFSAGLDYRCYEGAWGFIPVFSKLHPVKTGVATNFDLNVRTRNENVGLEFNGFISIPHDGVYTFYTASDDASRLYVGEPHMAVQVLSNGPMPRAIGKLPATFSERNSSAWVTLEGTVKFVGGRPDGGELQMQVGNDDIQMEIFESGQVVPSLQSDTQIRVSGIYQDIIAGDGSLVPGMLRISSWNAIRPVPPSEKDLATATNGEDVANRSPGETASEGTAIPAITTAAEVKSLAPELAKKQLPVSIRGVVTAVLPAYIRGAVIQDSTKGIFISLEDIKDSNPLQRGEFYQIEGVTGPGSFAPIVVAHHITHLGTGQLPRPLQATWDQLVNGTLDTQFAEIEGVVTSVHDSDIVMLTEGGKIALELSDFPPEDLERYENVLVRIRGCAFAIFNEQTHELDASSLRVMGGTVDVLRAAPRDLFNAPQKKIGELLLYDPKAAPFRRVKVSGQVIYGRDGEFFLTDGTSGIRVTATNPDLFAVGDLVEAVGFLELGGSAAELKEAVMRKIGRAPLSAPIKLTPEHLLQASHANMLVQFEATLVNQWREDSEYVLGLQSGFIAFRARVESSGQSVPTTPSGSRLELTGVYVAQGGRSGSGTVNGFEILMSSPKGIRVLTTPPWWTLQRVLILSAILAALLCGALLWNKELQWKVQERGRQLEIEIRNRQQVELLRAAEAERSRISRDLHDELGTGLTEVSLLANAGLGELRGVEKNYNRFRVIAEKARRLVSGLDVIVWAIDPKRDSLQSFADYLGIFAEDLFSASDIICRFKIPIEFKTASLAGFTRHSLLLAVKEALNNVIRHSSATEVELKIAQCNDCLEIVITDNGRGFDIQTVRPGNGLKNLHQRMNGLHGSCHVESFFGKGTTIKLSLPL